FGFAENTDDLFVGKTLLHGDVLMWLMKTLLTSGCTNQRGAGQRIINSLFKLRFHLTVTPFTLLILIQLPNTMNRGLIDFKDLPSLEQSVILMMPMGYIISSPGCFVETPVATIAVD
ncbi:hypothetical protein N8Y79_17430, partial [Enterobacter hormaechei subsp. steigerwaltii]|nr:hypothetical protein [Enterobacter hormaechei subsp. steigerwaltii]